MPPRATVIDLTGRAPGLVYALGAQPLNSPWVPGGAPGSREALRVTLDRLACPQLGSVWLLDQPGGLYDMAGVFYIAVGAQISDFDVLGEVDLPPRRATTATATDATIEPPIRLLRDRRLAFEAEQDCRSARAGR